MSKKKNSKRNKKQEQTEVTTVAPEKQEENVSKTKEKQKGYKIAVVILICLISIIFVGWNLNALFSWIQSEKDSEEAIIQHDKQEMYKAWLDLQWETIDELKSYKKMQEDSWKERYEYEENSDSFLTITTLHGDNISISSLEINEMIRKHVEEIQGEKLYEEIMPSSLSYNLNRKKYLPNYLLDLENLISEFPKSYRINLFIKLKLESKKEEIQRDIKDKNVLQRVWNLQKQCSENLDEIEKIFNE